MKLGLVGRVAVLLLAATVFFCARNYAQSTSATITGQITDQSGRLVPGAAVVFTNINTSVPYTTQTNAEGIYSLPTLQPGIYRANVTKDGFKSIVKPDIELHVQDQVSINFALQLGSVSETITVEAGTPLVNTQNATVSTVVDRQFAENLPLNGRSFQTLIQLTPGVVVVPSNFNDNGQFSVNGQRAASNYWMVDGVSGNIGTGVNAIGTPGSSLAGTTGSFSALGGTNSLVSVDAMQEFRIQTSTYAPEFGRTPGGQISIVTRSGANQFHGTAFDYVRNDIFDAKNWFDGYTNNPPLPKAKERQNDFGGTFSGPILKNRTFFFFSYEGLRLRLPQTTLSFVPDASFTPGGTTNSRQNALPGLQPYLNAYPLPNPTSPEIFVPCSPTTDPTCPASGEKATGYAAFNASYSNPGSLDAYSLRIDHRFSDALVLFGRYNYSPSEIDARGGGDSTLSTVSATRITTQTATLGATWSLSQRIANDLRFNYSHVDAEGESYLDDFGGAMPLNALPLPSPFSLSNSHFTFEPFSLLPQGTLNVGQNDQNLQRQINIIDNLSVQEKSHTLKFGFDYRRLTPGYRPASYEQSVYFSDVPSAATGTLEFYSAASNLTPVFLFRNLGFYAQDTWRVVPRLTLTYGIRWDLDFVPQTLSGPNFPAVTGFDLQNLASLSLAPSGTTPYKTTYGNVAPRLGLAYQLSQSQEWQTVVRGGGGIFYDLASSEAGNSVAQGVYPFGAFAFGGGTFPLNPLPPAPPIAPPTATNPGEVLAIDPHLRLPYTIEWNVALEQALGKEQSISASYVAALGRRLLQTAFVYAPNPSLSGASLLTNQGTSDYNALEIQFQRRLSQGIQALASYTWSHSIDTGSAGSNALSSNELVPSAANANRGSSDFDIRNAFSTGITWDMPAPNVNTLAKEVLGGWSLESVIQARSAPPVDVSDSTLYEFTGGIAADVRPDFVPGVPVYLYGSQYPGGKAFNPAAFTNPPVDPTTGLPLRQGDVPRNALRGFGATEWDFAVHRILPIHESLKLEFRAEVFNVLNHPNFGPPNGQFGSSFFGLSTQMLGQSLDGGTTGFSNSGGGAFNPLYQIGGPRSIQLSLKLIF
ncbi:MAG: TonB-dependent receptor [Candidatus Acidiferrales bacterium]